MAAKPMSVADAIEFIASKNIDLGRASERHEQRLPHPMKELLLNLCQVFKINLYNESNKS